MKTKTTKKHNAFGIRLKCGALVDLQRNSAGIFVLTIDVTPFTGATAVLSAQEVKELLKEAAVLLKNK